jgi:hypothetical protein
MKVYNPSVIFNLAMNLFAGIPLRSNPVRINILMLLLLLLILLLLYVVLLLLAWVGHNCVYAELVEYILNLIVFQCPHVCSFPPLIIFYTQFVIGFGAFAMKSCKNASVSVAIFVSLSIRM